jgi:hypothetical protein
LEETKRCPFCAEEILVAAIRCKHCQADLTAGAGLAAARRSPGEAIGIINLLLPLGSTALVWLWVGGMGLLQHPDSSLMFVAGLTVVASAILVAVEASQAGAGSRTDLDRRGSRRSGPVVWFFATCLLWLLIYPAWFFQRGRYGLKNMVVGGVLVALVFVGSLVIVGNAINEQMERAGALLRGMGL